MSTADHPELPRYDGPDCIMAHRDQLQAVSGGGDISRSLQRKLEGTLWVLDSEVIACECAGRKALSEAEFDELRSALVPFGLDARPGRPLSEILSNLDVPEPCHTAPADDLPPRLVATLYWLLLDRIQPGELEDVILSADSAGADVSLANPHILALARAHATHMLGGPKVPVSERLRRQREEFDAGAGPRRISERTELEFEER